jgi:hypothetical protein
MTQRHGLRAWCGGGAVARDNRMEEKELKPDAAGDP